MLSNQFFTLSPECLRGFGIKCVRTNAFAVDCQRLVLGDDLADVAVLAILSADLFRGRHKASPDRSGGSLRNRLVLKRLPACCCGFFADSIDRRLRLSWVEMPSKLGLDASRMNGGGSNPAVAMPQVERYCKKDVCRLRSTVCNPWVVRSALEVGVLKIDVGEAVPRGCEIDQPSAWSEKRRNPVHQDEVAEVIRAELRFESIFSMTKRCRHDTSIGNNHIERLALFKQRLGASSHTC